MITKRRKIKFIINPISSFGRKKIIEKLVRETLAEDKYYYEIVYTVEPGQGTALAKGASETGYDTVVAVGGDGSINEIAKGLIGTATKLGIIPAGSGNGLARHLKIPFNPTDAIKLILEDNTKKIDTININNEKFVSIAGIGYDGFVAKEYAKAGKHGFWSYFKIISQNYLEYKPKKYNLNIDGNELTVKALMINFANSSQFGYNTSISPNASLEDGLIDVCILKKIPVVELPLLAQLLFIKQIHRTKYVKIIQAKHIIVERKRNRYINLDGESVKLGKRLEITVNPKSLNLLVP